MHTRLPPPHLPAATDHDEDKDHDEDRDKDQDHDDDHDEAEDQDADTDQDGWHTQAGAPRLRRGPRAAADTTAGTTVDTVPAASEPASPTRPTKHDATRP